MLGSNLNSPSQVDAVMDRLKFDISSNVDLNSPLMFGEFLDSHLNYWCLSEETLETMTLWMLHILACKPGSVSHLTGSDIPAGYTYLGQMIAHDIVSNTSSSDKRKVTPWLNLDSIYPEVSSDEFEEYLDPQGRFHLNLEGSWQASWDFARDCQGTKTHGRAKILEPRNDENIILSQIVVEWMKFHNKAIDYLLGCGCERAEDHPTLKKENYIKARSFGILVFQHFIVNDYLKHILSPSVYEYYFGDDSSENSCKKSFYNSFRKSSDSVPFEFSHAIFRFGHSTVHDNYTLSHIDGKRVSLNLDKILQKNRPLKKEERFEWDRFFFSEDKSLQPIEGDLNVATGIDIFIAADLGGSSVGKFQAATLDPKSGDSLLKNLYSHMYKDQINEQVSDIRVSDCSASLQEGMEACKIKFSDLAKGMVNLVIQDILTSSKVPTAGDLFRAILSDEVNQEDIFQIMGLKEIDLEHLDTKIFAKTRFNQPVKVKGRKGSCNDLNIDNCPLWLYTLLEAEKYPPREPLEGENSGDETGGDKEKLGPLASFIVADVMNASIFDAKTSIYRKGESEKTLGILGEQLQQLKQLSLNCERDFTFRHIHGFVFKAKH